MEDKSVFTIARVYSDADGESHFDTFQIKMNSNGDIGYLSDVIPSKGIIFRKTSPAYNYSWHNAPCRQFVVNLNANVEITVSDGERRIMKQGDVFFLEDTHGKGHYSKSVESKERLSLFLPVSDEFTVPV